MEIIFSFKKIQKRKVWTESILSFFFLRMTSLISYTNVLNGTSLMTMLVILDSLFSGRFPDDKKLCSRRFPEKDKK